MVEGKKTELKQIVGFHLHKQNAKTQIMNEDKIIEILKNNCHKAELPNGNPVYEFREGDLKIIAKEISKIQ